MSSTPSPRAYGTLAVHLPANVIERIESQAATERRSKSSVLAEIITREMAAAPEPRIQFVRRRRKPREEGRT